MSLTPISVVGSGRSGSTALMALLGSNPRVAFDRRYPFEVRYLTYMAKLALLTGRPGLGPHLDGVQLSDYDDGHFGSFPWPTDPKPEIGPPLAPPPAAWLTGLWQTFSRAARDRHPDVSHYAEKVPEWLPAALRGVIPARTLYLVRDPRDIYLSIQAFSRARATTGFGRRAGDTDLDHARSLARDLLLYHENYRADRGRDDCLLVRYEDLVLRPAEAATRLGKFLGLGLSPAALVATAIPSDHRTSRDPRASVGRWQREGLPEGVRATLEAHLHELLADGDYGRDGAAAPAAEVRFADLLAHDPRPTCSADGELTAGPDGTAGVRLTGGDFWVALPPEEFAAKAVREVWVCLRGTAGAVCSLYWRGPHESFEEARGIHLPFQPGGHWQVLRFRAAGHPLWRGRIAQLRVDLFNGPVAPGDAGAVRWLRRVA